MVALTAPARIADGTVPVRPIQGGLLDAATVIDATDPHVPAGGFEYETAFCGPSHLAAADCSRVAQGSITGAASAARLLTLTLTGVPAGAYPLTVTWGDGAQSTVPSGTTATHTYAANGTYTVAVNGGGGYAASGAQVINSAAPGATAPLSPTGYTAKTASDGVGWATGQPFAVYHLAKCRTVGSIEGAEARAILSLSLGENRAVEDKFQDLMDAATPAVVTPGGSHAVDAVAALEQYAATVYGGQPVLHMSRDIATVLAAYRVIERDGTGLVTVLGTPVAAGGGYTGTKIYATGAVLLERSSPQSIGPVVNQVTNEYQVLVERLYAGSWECFVATATVTDTSWVVTP